MLFIINIPRKKIIISRFGTRRIKRKILSHRPHPGIYQKSPYLLLERPITRNGRGSDRIGSDQGFQGKGNLPPQGNHLFLYNARWGTLITSTAKKKQQSPVRIFTLFFPPPLFCLFFCPSPKFSSFPLPFSPLFLSIPSPPPPPPPLPPPLSLPFPLQ